MAAGNAQDRIPMQEPELKGQDVLPHSANHFQERRVRAGMRLRQLAAADTEIIRRQADAVELLRVVKHRLQTLRPHVGANALHHSNGGQCLAKDFSRQFLTAGRDKLRLRRQLRAQTLQLFAGRRFAADDAPYFDIRHGEALRLFPKTMNHESHP